MSAAPSHLTHAETPSQIESVFYAVHDSLLSGVVSHYDSDPPPVPETENRTVLQRIKCPPADCTEPSGRGGEHEGGREASAALDTCDESSLASQFESLRASIASQLQRTPAASPPVFFKPDDAGYPPVLLREASDSTCALQAEAIEERAAPTLTIDRPTVCTSAEENTVLINARKPACEPNPAAANASDAGRLASGNARQAVKGKLKKTPRMHLPESSEVVFGYQAMREALESHRRHYEAARSQIRISHGLKPEAAPTKPKAPHLCAASTKTSGPTLATATRSRKLPEMGEGSDGVEGELSKLRAARGSQTSGRNAKAKPRAGSTRGGGGAGKLPLKKPSQTEQANIVPVLAPGRPPTFETIRQTERMVAAANLPEPVLPPEDPPPASAIGSGPPPQAVSIASLQDEARQAKLLCRMRLNSDSIYRKTLSALN
ncbi:MAG: hypothetical protein SGPRY_013742 [Prymnesium sp.]